MPASPDIDALLRARGIRPTRHRVALARLLLDGRCRHVTAEAVHMEAHAAGTPVALATVYNTLNQLRSAGLLGEVVVEAGRAWFDTNTTHHFHLFDEATGELSDLPPFGDMAAVPIPAGTELSRVDVVVRVRRP